MRTASGGIESISRLAVNRSKSYSDNAEPGVAMPRYFFHFVRGEARIPDPDGIDISESDMTSLRGAKIVSEMLKTFPKLFEGWEDWSVEVVDELGTVVQTFTLEDSSEAPTSGSDEGSQRDGQRSDRLH